VSGRCRGSGNLLARAEHDPAALTKSRASMQALVQRLEAEKRHEMATVVLSLIARER